MTTEAAPKVSVILPVYNRSCTLGNAARSVLLQDFRDLELIIVDDASTQDLRPHVETLDDPRVRYIRLEKNGGVSVARNAGLALARGEFIAFQDSDDLWLPFKLTMQMDCMASLPPEYGVVVNSKILYGRGGTKSEYGSGLVSIRPDPRTPLMPEEDQVRRFLVGNRISLQNTLFRRECYPGKIWFDPLVRANADWAFTASLAQHTRIFENPEPVVLAFISDDSISKRWRSKTIGMLRILRQNREQFRRYPREYAFNLWRIGRMMMNNGKPRGGARLCRRALLCHPLICVDIFRRKLG